jgi:hypothetical protein
MRRGRRFGSMCGGDACDERSAARPMFGGAWLAVLALVACSPDPVRTEPRAYGVQLHTHGSLSEGPASMRAHAVAAGELDGAVDAIWWTDHDWRIAGHTYVTGFDFESGLSELEPVPAPLRMAQIDGREPMPDWAGGEPANEGSSADSGIESVRTGFSVRHMPTSETRVRMQVDDREARDGARSLLLSLDAPAKGRDALVLGFESQRRRQIASLPVVITGDVRMRVSVALSQTRPGERNAIDFVLEPADAAAAPGDPTIAWRTTAGETDRVRVATIPVPTEPGVWNDWRLDLTDLATRHGLGGIDNSLVDLSLAVEVADGGHFEAWVDALGIDRAVLGEPLFEIERGLARDLTTPALTHHVGQEISYAAHLNAYGMDVPLVDQTRFPHGMTPVEAVEWAHARSGLVSLNHYFGTEYTMISHRFPRSREALDASIARLIEQRAFGVDLLEVGYRSRGHGLAAFVELWDALSRAGIALVGIGVSDSHDAEIGWTQGPNNFITWIYADSVVEADLLAGLRGGRAFFGDPTLFDGLLDLSSDSGARMGDVQIVEPGPQVIEVMAVGLRAGQSLRVIRDGEVMAEHASGEATLRARHTIEVGASTFVRIEVMADGEPIVLSNPIHFVVRGPE